MAASSSLDSSDEITGINVTPLVDVMLVLLIIFMVTASYIVNQTIKVSLPHASTGEDGPTTSLAFVLDKDSKLYLDGKPLELGGLEAAIADYRSKGKPLQAVIAADKATPHGAVMGLIDGVRHSGIDDFAISVEGP